MIAGKADGPLLVGEATRRMPAAYRLLSAQQHRQILGRQLRKTALSAEIIASAKSRLVC